MSQDLSTLIPSLIASESIPYLKTKPGILGKVYSRNIPENELTGGKTVKFHLPAAIFTPTDVNYASSAATQDISLSSVDLTVDTHKEVKITFTELEDIYSQGGSERIINETIPGIIDGLITVFDKKLTALYASFTNSVGSLAGTDVVTDVLLRAALLKLANGNVDLEQANNVHLLLGTKSYLTDLLGIDRYVTPLNVGQVQNPSSIVTGTIPTLFNVSVGYSKNVQQTTISSHTVEHNLMFNKYAFGIGFTKFNPATKYVKNAPVDETLIFDKTTGVMIRMQKYYTPEKRSAFLQFDIAGGVCVLDASRFVRILSQVAA